MGHQEVRLQVYHFLRPSLLPHFNAYLFVCVLILPSIFYLLSLWGLTSRFLSRSSGAGGQNVNKLSTKVEVRFVVSDADWLPHDVRLRLARHQSGRINSRGELVVTAQEFRQARFCF